MIAIDDRLKEIIDEIKRLRAISVRAIELDYGTCRKTLRYLSEQTGLFEIIKRPFRFGPTGYKLIAVWKDTSENGSQSDSQLGDRVPV